MLNNSSLWVGVFENPFSLLQLLYTTWGPCTFLICIIICTRYVKPLVGYELAERNGEHSIDGALEHCWACECTEVAHTCNSKAFLFNSGKMTLGWQMTEGGRLSNTPWTLLLRCVPWSDFR